MQKGGIIRKAMIQGFEDCTAPLTDYERDAILPRMVHFLSLCNGSENAVKNTDIVNQLRDYGCKKVGDVRVRKVINHIRIHALVPCLVASSRGYYVTDDPAELDKFISSLAGREDAIRAVRISMEKQRNTIAKQ